MSADRLREVLRPDDVAARLGGDEFADPAGRGARPDPLHGRRQPHHRGAAGHLPGRRARRSRSGASVGVADRPTRDGDGRRGAAQRRRRDVHGQGLRQEPRRRVRADDAHGHRRAPRHECRTVAEPRPGRARGRLPAHHRPRHRRRDRRRGAGPLEAPDARPDRAQRLHPPGRGDRRDPGHRGVGPRRGVRPGQPVGRLRPPRSGCQRHRQPVGAAARRGLVRGRPAAHARPDRPAAGTPHPRDDRDRPVPRHLDDHRPARGHPGPRRPDRDRRLRDRLLVARVPAPVPGRHPQDRPRVRRLGRQPRGVGVRRGDRRAGPDPRAWPSSPKASRRRASSSGCGHWAASSARASSSLVRPMPRRRPDSWPATREVAMATPGRRASSRSNRTAVAAPAVPAVAGHRARIAV